MKDLIKNIAVAVAPVIAVNVTLLTIGAIANRVERKRMLVDAEHYANCPKNKI